MLLIPCHVADRPRREVAHQWPGRGERHKCVHSEDDGVLSEMTRAAHGPYDTLVIWALLLTFLFLLFLPSARLHVFDGLPVSSLAEFAALFLMLPLCASGALRRVYARPLQSRRG